MKMTVLFKEFSEYVKECKKIMKIIGVDVIDENFQYSYILMGFMFVVIAANITGLYSFYEAIKEIDFERMLKVCFVLGITIQVALSAIVPDLR
jgi:hypothetical protein